MWGGWPFSRVVEGAVDEAPGKKQQADQERLNAAITQPSGCHPAHISHDQPLRPYLLQVAHKMGRLRAAARQHSRQSGVQAWHLVGHGGPLLLTQRPTGDHISKQGFDFDPLSLICGQSKGGVQGLQHLPAAAAACADEQARHGPVGVGERPVNGGQLVEAKPVGKAVHVAAQGRGCGGRLNM